MKNNNTFSRHKISQLLGSMGLQEIIADDKQFMVYGTPQGSNIVAVPLQKGRCHKNTFRNALQNMTKRLPTHLLDRLASGQNLSQTKQKKTNSQLQTAYKPLPPLSRDISQRQLSFNQIITVFAEAGWSNTGTTGSHKIFKPHDSNVTLSLTSHGGKKKEIKALKMQIFMTNAAKVNGQDIKAQKAIHTLHKRMVQELQA
jgi:predicted RNA binding protein YcfA (HicA-like mRNA interferase family)